METETLYHKMIKAVGAWLTGAGTVVVLNKLGVWFINTIGAMATAICVSYSVYVFQNWLQKRKKKKQHEQDNHSA